LPGFGQGAADPVSYHIAESLATDRGPKFVIAAAIYRQSACRDARELRVYIEPHDRNLLHSEVASIDLSPLNEDGRN
jgi:hypothetical protein